MVDPESPPLLADLDRRAWVGMRQLFRRQLVNLVVGLAAGITLARTLSPAEFGAFAIISFVVAAFTILGDLGLNASLIQRREPPADEELQHALAIQLILATAVVIAVWIAATWLTALYPRLGPNTVWLTRLFALSLFFVPLRSISLVRLERALRYRPIAFVEMAESFVFQATAVGLALSGFGVASFVIAALARGLVGAVALYRASPWPLKLRLGRGPTGDLLRYGFSFQAGGILQALSGWVTPALVGTIAGPGAVGYLGLAGTTARRPLTLVDAVMRVSFPHFSALQSAREELDRRVIAYLVGFIWVVSSWLAFLLVVGRPLIELLYSSKWHLAVVPMLIFAGTLPLEVIFWTMGFSYAAVNRNWDVVRILSARSLLNIAVAVTLVPTIGYLGVPLASLASAILVAPVLLARFSPGFLRTLLGAVAWIVPAVGGAYAAGRLGAALAGHGSARLLAVGGFVEIVAFLILSMLLAPSAYRAIAKAAAIGRLRQLRAAAAAAAA